MIRALFSDIDNTIIHSSSVKKALHLQDDGRVISRRSISLLYQIGRHIPVILITGRRMKSYERIMRFIPHGYAVLEHGCVILQGKHVDPHYAHQFREYVGRHPDQREGYLWEYETMLKQQGFLTDSEGRIATFRVDPAQQHHPPFPPDHLLNRDHPHHIKTVINLNFIDFMPPMGGKENAIHYLLKIFHCNWNDVACFGDDHNDAEMLSKAGYAFTHDGAREEIKRLVERKKGYISPHAGHDGAADVFSRILGMVDETH